MITVLDKHIAAYRRLPSPRNRARLAWKLCKYVACIPLLSIDDYNFLKTHEFF